MSTNGKTLKFRAAKLKGFTVIYVADYRETHKISTYIHPFTELKDHSHKHIPYYSIPDLFGPYMTRLPGFKFI